MAPSLLPWRGVPLLLATLVGAACFRLSIPLALSNDHERALLDFGCSALEGCVGLPRRAVADSVRRHHQPARAGSVERRSVARSGRCARALLGAFLDSLPLLLLAQCTDHDERQVNAGNSIVFSLMGLGACSSSSSPSRPSLSSPSAPPRQAVSSRPSSSTSSASSGSSSSARSAGPSTRPRSVRPPLARPRSVALSAHTQPSQTRTTATVPSGSLSSAQSFVRSLPLVVVEKDEADELSQAASRRASTGHPRGASPFSCLVHCMTMC